MSDVRVSPVPFNGVEGSRISSPARPSASDSRNDPAAGAGYKCTPMAESVNLLDTLRERGFIDR